MRRVDGCSCGTVRRMDAPITAQSEALVRSLVDEWLAPLDDECLACYLDRSVTALGCGGDLRFAAHYRDLIAPRATTLERRLSAAGGYCDCEVLMNAMQPARRLWASPPRRVPFAIAALEADEGDVDALGDEEDGYGDRDDEPDDEQDLEPPLVMPPCAGVRRGTTRPCGNWQLL